MLWRLPKWRTSAVHRLTFGGNIIETGTDSYRLATTRAEQQTWLGVVNRTAPNTILWRIAGVIVNRVFVGADVPEEARVAVRAQPAEAWAGESMPAGHGSAAGSGCSEGADSGRASAESRRSMAVSSGVPGAAW